MADQKRWYKVWSSILTDPDFSLMPVADIGRWVLLGATIAQCGTNGTLRVPRLAYLTRILRCEQDGEPSDSETLEVLANFPHITISECPVSWAHGRGKRVVSAGVVWRGGELVNGGVANVDLAGCEMFEGWCKNAVDFFVTYENWSQYQLDTTSRERGEKLRSKRRGEEKRGEENKKNKKLTPPPPSEPALFEAPKRKDQEPESRNGKWPSPKLLIAKYNAEGADELRAVEAITPARIKKAREYLRIFPDEQFWTTVFAETKRSELLRGLKPSAGHENFKGDFDWLLSKGKDGAENCAKVFEGKYRDE